MNNELRSRIDKFEKFDLDGNHVVLDFLNTVDWRGTPREHDWLKDYLDVLAWTNRTGLATEEEIDTRASYAAELPKLTENAHYYALDTRELLYRIIATGIGRHAATAEDWRELNIRLSKALSKLVLVPTAGDPYCRVEFDTEPDDLLWFLPPLLHRARELLTTPHEGRIKQCSTDNCGWLFYDTSKNNGRRWCSPGCGNRTKVKRTYYRKKRASA